MTIGYDVCGYIYIWASHDFLLRLAFVDALRQTARRSFGNRNCLQDFRSPCDVRTESLWYFLLSPCGLPTIAVRFLSPNYHTKIQGRVYCLAVLKKCLEATEIVGSRRIVGSPCEDRTKMQNWHRTIVAS